MPMDLMDNAEVAMPKMNVGAKSGLDRLRGNLDRMLERSKVSRQQGSTSSMFTNSKKSLDTFAGNKSKTSNVEKSKTRIDDITSLDAKTGDILKTNFGLIPIETTRVPTVTTTTFEIDIPKPGVPDVPEAPIFKLSDMPPFFDEPKRGGSSKSLFALRTWNIGNVFSSKKRWSL